MLVVSICYHSSCLLAEFTTPRQVEELGPFAFEMRKLGHDNVKRTIETLGGKGVVTLPQIEEVKNNGPGP